MTITDHVKDIPVVDNTIIDNMADAVNPTTQTNRYSFESDVRNGELKQFILDMKHEIMSILAENQQKWKEMRDKSSENNGRWCWKATSDHAWWHGTENLTRVEKQYRKVHELKEKLLLLEIHDRKNNLLIYGVEEKEKEDINQVMLDTWYHNFSVNDEQLDHGIIMTAEISTDALYQRKGDKTQQRW